jgi:hypothetical protein
MNDGAATGRPRLKEVRARMNRTHAFSGAV